MTGGNGTYTWAAATGLPAGLTATGSGATLTISGTPTAAGTFTVTLSASDTESTPKTATATLTITVGAAVSITTTSLTAGTEGTAYSATVAATGGTGTATWTATGLPAGLSISSAGTISGTPTASGNFSVVVTATAGTSASATLGLVINPAAVVTASPTPSRDGVGDAFADVIGDGDGDDRHPVSAEPLSGALDHSGSAPQPSLQGRRLGGVPHPIEVDSAADARLADYTRLTDAALRIHLEAEHGLFIAEGTKVITRAVAAGYPVRSLLLGKSRLADLPALAEAAAQAPLYVVPDEVAESLTGYRVHRGALASLGRKPLPEVRAVTGDARRVVVLEDLVDHGNVGAIFRCAAALGVDAVVLSPRCADPLYRRSVKVSMGAVFTIPYARMTGWHDGLAELKSSGFRVLALTPTSARPR